MTKVFRLDEAAPAPVPDNTPRFPQIHVLPTGALRSGTATIELYGVTLPRRGMICTSPAANRWACGTAAYIALRNLVESQTLACEQTGAGGPAMTAACRIGQINVSVWLLQMGWAELSDGVTDRQYIDAAAIAKARDAGIWGDKPNMVEVNERIVRPPTFTSPTVFERRFSR